MIETTLQIVNPAKYKVKQFKSATRLAMEQIALYWHEKLLPKHFTSKAIGEYGYKQRAKLTVMKKMKYGTANTPMVKTGKLKNAMMQQSQINNIKTKSKNMKKSDIEQYGSKRGLAQFTLVYKNLPFYVRLLGQGKLRAGYKSPRVGPAKRGELTRVSTKESYELASHLQKTVIELIENAATETENT